MPDGCTQIDLDPGFSSSNQPQMTQITQMELDAAPGRRDRTGTSLQRRASFQQHSGICGHLHISAVPTAFIGLLVLVPGVIGARAAETQWHGGSSLVWHSNVTNADRVADRLPAMQWQSELTAGATRVPAAGHLLRADWRFGLDLWPRYQGLDTVSTGPALGWTRRFGLGSQAPAVALQAQGDWVGVREAARSGRSGSLTAQLQKRFGREWQGFAGVDWRKFQARSHAFNRAGREYFLRMEYQPGPDWRFAAEIRQRQGDVISYTSPPRPDLVQAGKVLTLVDTFERSGPLLAYYFPAETRSGWVDLSRSISPVMSVSMRFEYRDTTHNAVRYRNSLSTLGVSRRF